VKEGETSCLNNSCYINTRIMESQASCSCQSSRCVRALPFEEDFIPSNTNIQLYFLPNQKSIILLSDDRTIPQSKSSSYQGLL